jgi:hypothetical protein
LVCEAILLPMPTQPPLFLARLLRFLQRQLIILLLIRES